MRILAVDDDPVFLNLLAGFLGDLGYRETVYCTSGSQALRELTSDSRGFDCFLFDIQMPIMDGIELCKRVQAIPRHARTPVLMLTAMAETQYIDAAFLAGASDYITKPLKRAELTARLSHVATINQDRARQALIAGPSGTSRIGSMFRFSDPIRLHDVHGILELMALKNYALTLGNFRMQQWKAIGFATKGASEFYSSCGPEQYFELMEDVGSVLFDTLKQGQLMMAHAGSGCFVALVSRHCDCSCDILESQANAYLQPFNDYYRDLSDRPIEVVAGTEQRNGLLSFQPADGLIDRAVASAQERAARAHFQAA